MLPTYTMYSHGTFSIRMDPAHQCGEAGEREFAYEVDVEVYALDADGFVFDNADVERALRAAYGGRRTWHASCELLAGGIVRIIHPKVAGRVRRIEASIRPVMPDGSDARRWMTCRWTSGSRLPEGPRLSSDDATPFDDGPYRDDTVDEGRELAAAEWEGMAAANSMQI